MVKTIVQFLIGLMTFWKWNTDRKDVRAENKYQSNAAKEFVKNEEDINKLYPTRSSSDNSIK
jgi:hypothetical protein